MSMGDRIAVMKDGVIMQVDEPSAVYATPSNRFVGSFIGNPPMNFIDGVVRVNGDDVVVTIGENEIPVDSSVASQVASFDGRPITLGIRAENMVALDAPAEGALPVTVHVVEPLGSQNLLTVDLGGHRMKVSTHPTFDVKADDSLWIQFPPNQIRWIDPETEDVLGAPIPA
jgi:multiple sugar transport system ATP-binding protein